MKGSTGAAKVSALRKFAAPWFALPADITGDGKVRIEGSAGRRRRGTRAPMSPRRSTRVDLTNEASTIVTDKLAATCACARASTAADTLLELESTGKRRPGAASIRCCSISARIRWRWRHAATLARRRADHRFAAGRRRTDLLEMTGSGTREPGRRDSEPSAAISSSRRSSSPRRSPATCRSLLATSVLGDAQDPR